MKLLTKDIINEVSLETGIAPSYIEKDYYLVQTLSVLTNISTAEHKIVFAGGTSLSKAYGIISRFSEDVDFSVVGLETANRTARSKYKDEIISRINMVEGLSVDNDTIKSRDESRYVNFYIEYPKVFALGSSLRNNLKMEVSFKPTYLPTETKEIKSFIGQFTEDSPKAVIECISPVETAANKFSALLWRVDIKDRTQPLNHMTNDPALMRHLHDLSALFPSIETNPTFVELVKEIYEQDCHRGDKMRTLSLKEFITKTLHTLKADEVYRKEYEEFVATMAYGNTKISFDTALSHYEEICQFVMK
jgi:predicted nucleotidyltransferase component of viral defense system